MNREIVIRQLYEKDIDEHRSEISKYIFESVKMSNYETSYTKEQAEEKTAELLSYVSEKKAIVIGAFYNNYLIGFLWAYKYPFREDTNRLYISILHVMENYRDSHIGTKLITYVEEVAKNYGLEKIFLHSEASNSQACGFYEKNHYFKERIQFVKEL